MTSQSTNVTKFSLDVAASGVLIYKADESQWIFLIEKNQTFKFDFLKERLILRR